jgi:alkylhydroperoxidase family enzyme
VIRDWRTANVDDRVRAALAFVEKLARFPTEVGAADVDAARRAGLSDDAIEDAAFVCVLFTTYVRLADTFEFDIPPRAGFEQGADMLLSAGYTFPPPLAWLIRRRR